jgi:hypothetical protein
MEISKYQNGKIYQIVDNTYSKCYIGSTVESLSTRMSHHRATFKKRSKSSCSSVLLFEEFGVDNCKIELIEYFPCNNREELLAREGHHIKKAECVNKATPGLDTKSFKKEYDKQLYEQKRDKILENKKQYYLEKKGEVLNRRKTRIICECGCETSVGDKHIHMKSIKHKKLMDSKKLNIM